MSCPWRPEFSLGHRPAVIALLPELLGFQLEARSEAGMVWLFVFGQEAA